VRRGTLLALGIALVATGLVGVALQGPIVYLAEGTKQRENCVFWALRQLRRHGGYVALRRSLHFRWIPHLLWSPDLVTWTSYSPIRPKQGWKVLLDCLWFEGYIQEGDDV